MESDASWVLTEPGGGEFGGCCINATLRDYGRLGLPAEAFDSVQVLAPVRPGSKERMPATGSRQKGVAAYFWTLREVVTERLLRFLFAEAEDTASQLSFVVDKIEAKLAAFAPEAIINCAAYTNVGRAESEESLAYAVNADAVAAMARFAGERAATADAGAEAEAVA